MEADLKKKFTTRSYLKGIITRFHNFVQQDISEQSCELLLSKRERLVTVFASYEEMTQEILFHDPTDKENIEEVEENYLTAIAALDKAINCRPSTSQPPKHSTTLTKKLPPISIKCFEGQYTEYIPFINVFMSMIHNDSSLDVVQKLYYLRSYLKGEPFDLIKNLPVSAESYDVALSLLRDRYENKHRITSEHIAKLLDLKQIVKSTATSLRDFVSIVRQQLAAIKNQNPNVIYWDALLLCILLRKLDTYTARAYQLERDHDAEPKVEEFLKFIEKRASAMENVEHGQQARPGSKVAAHASTGKALSCSYCAVANPAYLCDTAGATGSERNAGATAVA